MLLRKMVIILHSKKKHRNSEKPNGRVVGVEVLRHFLLEGTMNRRQVAASNTTLDVSANDMLGERRSMHARNHFFLSYKGSKTRHSKKHTKTEHKINVACRVGRHLPQWLANGFARRRTAYDPAQK